MLPAMHWPCSESGFSVNARALTGRDERRSASGWTRATAAAWAGCLVLAGCLDRPVEQGERIHPPVRVGASGDYAPFSARLPVAQARGIPSSEPYVGFDSEIARRFAADEERALVWVPFRWPHLLERLAAGDFDVGMSGITIRPERSVAGRFSIPVAENGAVLLVPSDGITRGRDVAVALAMLDKPTHRIAVNQGGHLERITRSHFRAAQIRAIPDNTAVRRALVAGEVDAAVTDTLEARVWKEEQPSWAVIGPFTNDRKAYLLPAEEALLAARLDGWLLARERDGTLGRLREEYFGVGPWPRTALPLTALIAAADERLALMPFVADFKRRAGRALVDPAREERVLAAARAAVAAAAEKLRRAAPERVAVDAFYRAQIDAAVAVQQAVVDRPAPGSREHFDLERDLRPALIRIGERMAWLLAVAAGEPSPPDLGGRVRVALAHHKLPESVLDAVVEAFLRIGPVRAGGQLRGEPGLLTEDLPGEVLPR